MLKKMSHFNDTLSLLFYFITGIKDQSYFWDIF